MKIPSLFRDTPYFSIFPKEVLGKTIAKNNNLAACHLLRKLKKNSHQTFTSDFNTSLPVEVQ